MAQFEDPVHNVPGYHRLTMRVIKTKTTYLQMFSPPEVAEAEPSAPRPDLNVARVSQPSVEFYRRLYQAVGSDFHWVDRLVMADEELRGIIQDDQVDVFVLTVDKKPAGYSELDRRETGEIELAYFGLTPEVTGQGLGKYLLDSTLRAAWSYQPRRIWVHTCDLDHPAALPNYLRAGFQIYDQVTIDQWVPSEP